MTISKHIALASCLGFSLSGCGKHSDHFTPLTDAQKAEFKEVISSASAGTNAAVRTQARLLSLQNLIAPMASYKEEQYRPMEDSIQDGACNFEAKTPEQTKKMFTMSEVGALSTGNETFFFRVNGPNCPILIDINGQVSMGASSGQITLDIEYKVVKDEFRPLNDVDAFKLSFSANGSGDQTSAKATGNWNGSIHSQAKGNIGLQGNLSANKTANSKILTARHITNFPTFTVVLDASVKNGEKSYAINGESMTEEQVRDYFADAMSAGEGAASADLGQQNSEPQPTIPPSPRRPGTKK